MKTAKTLKFLYQWIGPHGPITNTRVPNLVDFAVAGKLAGVNTPVNSEFGDLNRQPYFYEKFKEEDVVIASTCTTPTGKALYEINFCNYHYRDWRKLFSTSDGIMQEQLFYIRGFEEANIYALVTVLYEGWVHDKFFDELHKFFEHLKFPLERVVYVNNCYNGEEIYKNYCERRSITPSINVEYFPSFRFDKTNLEHVSEKYKNIEYVPGPRKKDFLCFQRRWSDHRVAFYLDMHRKGLLDKFYMSMDATQPESGASYESNAVYLGQRYPQFKYTTEEIKDAQASLPLILDTHNFSSYPMESNEFDTEQYFKDSLINIISETFFFNKEIHITEKTFKPIAFMQPFIMMGAVGSLQHVKDMGFKTFSEFWDESYDTIRNDAKRYDKIVKLVEEIAAWSEEKKLEFSYNVKDIVEFNSKHFATMEHVELENFKNKYGN
jgi:hypothetical protein